MARCGRRRVDADWSTQFADTAASRRTAAALVEPTIRSEFADTALWVASLETNKDGMAEVELDMPENLTAWKIRAWGMGHGTRVGEASAEVVTRKNLIVRMQAPRFFVETRRSRAQRQRPQLSARRQASEGAAGARRQHARAADAPPKNTIEIPAGGEQRVDWRVKVGREGEAVIRMLALTDEESDAVK